MPKSATKSKQVNKKVSTKNISRSPKTTSKVDLEEIDPIKNPKIIDAIDPVILDEKVVDADPAVEEIPLSETDGEEEVTEDEEEVDLLGGNWEE